MINQQILAQADASPFYMDPELERAVFDEMTECGNPASIGCDSLLSLLWPYYFLIILLILGAAACLLFRCSAVKKRKKIRIVLIFVMLGCFGFPTLALLELFMAIR